MTPEFWAGTDDETDGGDALVDTDGLADKRTGRVAELLFCCSWERSWTGANNSGRGGASSKRCAGSTSRELLEMVCVAFGDSLILPRRIASSK